MAGYKGHTVLSVIIAVVLFFLFRLLATVFAVALFQPAVTTPWGISLLMMSVVLFGLWPDIDTNSVGQDIFYPLFFIFDAILIFAGMYKEAAIFGLFTMLPIMGKHRGWTHTVWAALGVPALIVVLPMLLFDTGFVKETVPFAIAASAGYLGHLLLDKRLFRRRS